MGGSCLEGDEANSRVLRARLALGCLPEHWSCCLPASSLPELLPISPGLLRAALLCPDLGLPWLCVGVWEPLHRAGRLTTCASLSSAPACLLVAPGLPTVLKAPALGPLQLCLCLPSPVCRAALQLQGAALRGLVAEAAAFFPARSLALTGSPPTLRGVAIGDGFTQGVVRVPLTSLL